MDQELRLLLNGKERQVETLASPAPLDTVLQQLALRADRIAVELNGELAPRSGWSHQLVHSGDRLEIVHFVGGGAGDLLNGCSARFPGQFSQQGFPAVAVP